MLQLPANGRHLLPRIEAVRDSMRAQHGKVIGVQERLVPHFDSQLPAAGHL